MSQIVVSDSTCLIALERIGRFDLLPAVFDQIWIPPAVAGEFGQPLPWLLVRAPTNLGAVAAYEALVDAGEASAIALAAELKCEVILDDLQARRLAAREGLHCVGTAGRFAAGETGRPAHGGATDHRRAARTEFSRIRSADGRGAPPRRGVA